MNCPMCREKNALKRHTSWTLLACAVSLLALGVALCLTCVGALFGVPCFIASALLGRSVNYLQCCYCGHKCLKENP